MTKAGWIDDHSRDSKPIDADLVAAGAYALVIAAGVAAFAIGGDPYWLTLPVWFAALLPGTELLSRRVTRLGALGRGRPRRSPVQPVGVRAGPTRGHETERGSPSASGVAATDERARAFEADAVALLKERYARGDLDEDEFEGRLELLMGLEDETATRSLERPRNR